MSHEGPDGPHRIEIELTPHEPVAGRRPGSSAAEAGGRPGGGDRAGAAGSDDAAGSGWLGSERSRLVAAMSGVGVAALLLGWMLGRGGDGAAVDEVEPSPVPTAVSPATIADEPDGPDEPDERFDSAETLPPDERFDSAETLPPADLDVAADAADEPRVAAEAEPTAPPPIVGTTGGLGDPEVFPLDERLRGTPVRLVGTGASLGSRLVDVDLAAGTAAVLDTDRDFAGWGIVAGPDWVVGLGAADEVVSVVWDDGRTVSMAGLDPWNVNVDVEAERLWGRRGRSHVDGLAHVFDEYTLYGERTGRTITVPAFAWGARFDGGGIVVSIVGTTFHIRPEGHEVLADGELVTVAPDILVVLACDDDLRCGYRVVDRATGEMRWIPDDPDAEPGAPRPSYTSPYPSGRLAGAGDVSPDGRYMAAIRLGWMPRGGVLDLDTGHFVEVAADPAEWQWVWSPDGRFGFYLDEMRPMAFEVATGEMFPVSPDAGVTWGSLIGRPATDAGSAAEPPGG